MRGRLRLVPGLAGVLIGWACAAATPDGPAHSRPGPLITRLRDAGAMAGLGVNVTFPDTTAADLQAIAKSGFHLIRFAALWASVETLPGDYDWARSDALIGGARRNGLVPLVVLAYSNPLYADRDPQRPDTESLAYAAPASGDPRAAYMAYARAAAERYGPDVVWEVWNEPDHNFGDPVDLKAYVAFAMEACTVIRAAVPGATVVGPAASGFNLPFLEDFVQADRPGCFDAVSVHPYRDQAPESVLGDWARARAIAERCPGAPGCPAVIDSEMGYASTGGFWSEQRQADYVARLTMLDQAAGIPISIIYDWRNDGTQQTEKEANFGLLQRSGAPKPVLATLTRLTGALGGLRYLGRLAVPTPSVVVLAFGRDAAVERIVAWSAGGQEVSVDLSGATLDQAPLPPGGGARSGNAAPRLTGVIKAGETPVAAAVAPAPAADGTYRVIAP